MFSAICYVRIGIHIWRRVCIGAMTQQQRTNQNQSKWKTIKMLITVVVVFAICWLPVCPFLTSFSYVLFLCPFLTSYSYVLSLYQKCFLNVKQFLTTFSLLSNSFDNNFSSKFLLSTEFTTGFESQLNYQSFK